MLRASQRTPPTEVTARLGSPTLVQVNTNVCEPIDSRSKVALGCMGCSELPTCGLLTVVLELLADASLVSLELAQVCIHRRSLLGKHGSLLVLLLLLP